MKKKIVILADFPRFAITSDDKDRPSVHFATWLPQLALAFEERDEFEISWIVIDGKISKKTILRAWNQTFYYLPRWKKSVAILTCYWADRRKIARVLGGINPEFVHAWGSEDAYGLALIDAKNAIGLLSMQGILTRCCKVVKQPWLLKIQAFWEAKVLRQVKYITCESPWGIKMSKKYAPNARFERVEYGVKREYFNVTRKPTGEKLALFVGGFSRLKGADTLLEAFRDTRLKDVSIKILGATAELAGVDDYPENVEFLGRLPSDQVMEWMSKAWCLVHPTRADTSPNCVKEARVVGLPVVTTNAGGQVQYVKHGYSGWIHEPGDVEGLIRGILEVTESVATSLKMGEYKREVCREELLPEKTASRFISIYEDMLKLNANSI